MIAFIEAYKEGLFKSPHIIRNIVSGLIVGVVALPLAMAFAIASGVKPEQGLYTAIIAGIAVGLFGGSRVQIAGPTGAFVVILAGVTAKYGVDGLQVATLMAGMMLALMGFMRLGNVIEHIPESVIVGFTSGIGLIIFIGQWKDFFGLSVSMPIDAAFHQKLSILLHDISKLDITTTALALVSLLLIQISPRLFKRIPGPLVAMLGATIIQMIFQFKSVATIGSTFGNIPQQLPSFQLPDLSANHWVDLLWPAFTIALLGAIESLLSAAVADTMAGTRHHSNQELIGQGLANMIAPMFGGFAATGAIARTATNVRNGGNSPLAAVVHSVLLIAVIVLLAPFAAQIPLCALAAILFVVAYHMSDVKKFAYIARQAPWQEVAVLMLTFGLTVFTNLVLAVVVGVVVSFALSSLTQYGSTEVE